MFKSNFMSQKCQIPFNIDKLDPHERNYNPIVRTADKGKTVIIVLIYRQIIPEITKKGV